MRYHRKYTKQKKDLFIRDLNGKVVTRQKKMILKDLGKKFAMTTGNILLKSMNYQTLKYRIRCSSIKISIVTHGLIIDPIIITQRTSAIIKDLRVYRVTDCGSDQYLVKGDIGWNWLNSRK